MGNPGFEERSTTQRSRCVSMRDLNRNFRFAFFVLLESRDLKMYFDLPEHARVLQ